MSDQPLVVQVPDPYEPDSDDVWLRPLFTCGHYGSPIFECSSQWDFPHDVFLCPECGKDVQMDLRLQVAVMTAWQAEDD